MLISDRRLLESLINFTQGLQSRTDVPADVSYDAEAANLILRQLAYLQSDDADIPANQYLAQMERQAELQARDGPAAENAGSQSCGPVATTKQSLVALADRLDKQLSEEVEAGNIGDPDLSLLRSHNRFFGSAFAGDTRARNDVPVDRIEVANLQPFLQDRFGDQSLTVNNISTLPGGLGKETTMFSVAGADLSGDFVLRRDIPVDPFDGLEAHTAKQEFQLLTKLHEGGVPVPCPILNEPRPIAIRGGGFSIVKRVPGEILGDPTQGFGSIPLQYQGILARQLATLHSSSIAERVLEIDHFREQCPTDPETSSLRHNISEYYSLYRRSERTPAPVVHALFDWLLRNIPEGGSPLRLVHGDIGFHNLLFHGDVLSAVLDWEFSHMGDPAEDLGYLRITMKDQINWKFFFEQYSSAGGQVPDLKRIFFCEIWSNIRNLVACSLILGSFETGHLSQIKYGLMLHKYVPYYLQQSEILIDQYDVSWAEEQTDV